MSDYEVAENGKPLVLVSPERGAVIGKSFWHKEGTIINFWRSSYEDVTYDLGRYIEGMGKQSLPFSSEDYSITVKPEICVNNFRYRFVCKVKFSLNDFFAKSDLNTICSLAIKTNQEGFKLFRFNTKDLLEQLIIDQFKLQEEWIITQVKEKTIEELIKSIQKFLFLSKKLMFQNLELKEFKVSKIFVSRMKQA